MKDAAERILKELCDNARRRNLKYLFTNPKTKTHYTTVKTAWKTACKLAEIVDLHFHDLRHTFGTRAADGGANLGDLQKVMGHALEHDDAICSCNGRGQAPSGQRGSGATGEGYQDDS